MSMAIVHPLLDSTLTQLNALRQVLDENPAVCMIDAAMAQINATKQMLGANQVRALPEPKQQETARPDGPRVKPMNAPKPAPKRGGNMTEFVSRDQLGEAIVQLMESFTEPVKKDAIEEGIAANKKALGLKGKLSLSSIKSTLLILVKSGRIIKTGDRNTTRYELP